MDNFFDYEPLTISPEVALKHLQDVNKSVKKRRKSNALQPENSVIIAGRSRKNND